MPKGVPEDSDYIAYCAARFWGYTLGEWMREDGEVQARVIAHFLEHNKRESFYAEAREEYQKRVSDPDSGRMGPPPDYSRYRQGGGRG